MTDRPRPQLLVLDEAALRAAGNAVRDARAAFDAFGRQLLTTLGPAVASLAAALRDLSAATAELRDAERAATWAAYDHRRRARRRARR